MQWQHVQSAAPYLLIIGYLLVASVLKVTAGHIHKHIARHDRVRAAKIRRLQYMREVAAYQARLMAVAAESSNVVIDDDDPDTQPAAEPVAMRRAA
jgi:hypothetical protein